MNHCILCPFGINHFEQEFNKFIRKHPWIEITDINFIWPIIYNPKEPPASVIAASIIYQ